MKKINILLSNLIIVCLIILSFASLKISARAHSGEELTGKVIYIDAGHGGKDNGASIGNILEDQINLKISEYLYQSLLELGAVVLMSRIDDYDLASLYQKNRKREDLFKRVNNINDSRPDVFVSIHLNIYSSENVKGSQVFYQKNKNSELLAQNIQTELSVLASNTRKTKAGDFYILNNTKYTGVLVECGFLSNPYEREKLNSEVYQRKIAKGIKDGIIKYFTIKE